MSKSVLYSILEFPSLRNTPRKGRRGLSLLALRITFPLARTDAPYDHGHFRRRRRAMMVANCAGWRLLVNTSASWSSVETRLSRRCPICAASCAKCLRMSISNSATDHIVSPLTARRVVLINRRRRCGSEAHVS